MLSTIFITALAATAALADPVQRRQATSSLDLSALESQASVLQGVTSDEPMLPSSVLEVLATAVPTSVLTDPNFACEAATGTPGWYKSLPADVKSALTSYESAAVSWYKEHSSVLAQFTSGLAAGPAACTAATNGAKTAAGATGSGAAATGTSGSGASGSSGSAATAASGSGNGAMARPTGLVAAGLAGAIGALGLAIAL